MQYCENILIDSLVQKIDFGNLVFIQLQGLGFQGSATYSEPDGVS